MPARSLASEALGRFASGSGGLHGMSTRQPRRGRDWSAAGPRGRRGGVIICSCDLFRGGRGFERRPPRNIQLATAAVPRAVHGCPRLGLEGIRGRVRTAACPRRRRRCSIRRPGAAASRAFRRLPPARRLPLLALQFAARPVARRRCWAYSQAWLVLIRGPLRAWAARNRRRSSVRAFWRWVGSPSVLYGGAPERRVAPRAPSRRLWAARGSERS